MRMQILEQAGQLDEAKKFNLDSQKQLGDFIFETLKAPTAGIKKTAKKGYWPTDEEVGWGPG
jgi:DNA polymerase I-like protein with 3'-5' exonuclease and polymerase domains